MNDSSRKNVVEIGNFDRSRVNAATAGLPLLNDCRDLTADGLAKAAAAMLDNAPDELLEQAEKASGIEMRNLYLDALTICRDQKAFITGALKRQFIQACNKQVRKNKGASAPGAAALNLADMELSLLDPDDLEESLAADNIANTIHGTCAEELFGIEKRVGLLLNEATLESSENPIGPEVIGSAYLDALKELDKPVKLRLILVMLFNKHMPVQIKTLYQNVNQHLVSQGVLPQIRVGVKKQASTARNQAPAPAAESAGSPAGSPDILGALQQLLALGSAAGNAAAASLNMGGTGNPGATGVPGLGLPAAGIQNAAALSALTKLQHGEIDSLLGGAALDASMLASGHVNVLREIKATSVASSLGQVDAMTLDIVAMLFDYILDDRNIPDSMKALIGRLQIPVLKVAMLDKSFFSQKLHPARKFLDTLADAAIGWNDDEGHQGGLYKKVDELVQRILNEFEDKVGVFVEVQADLESYLDAEKRKAAELAGRSAQLVQQREQAEIGRVLAQDEVRRRLEAHRMPEVIVTFLTTHWVNVLSDAYRQAGEDSQAWNDALETMNDLIWSVETKQEADERKKLVTLLPALLKRLQQGMASLDVDKASRDEFFAKLIRCHADAVKSGLNSTAAEDDQTAAAPDYGALFAHSNTAATGHAQDVEEIILTEEAPPADPLLVQQIVAPQEVLEEIPLALGDYTPGAEQADDFDAMVARLKRGTWVEFSQKDGSTVRNKLAWISPLKGLYLFTNRLGSRALSITPARLAEKLRGGEAQIINDSALVDRAVSDLMEKLQHNAIAA